MLDLLIIMLLAWQIDSILSQRLLIKRVKEARGMASLKEWSEKILWLSRANGYIGLIEIEERLTKYPRNEKGQMIYIVNADFHGVPLSMGLENNNPENCLGFYTNGQSYAKVFRYQRNFRGRLMVRAQYIGEMPKKSPHRPHSVHELPLQWQR